MGLAGRLEVRGQVGVITAIEARDDHDLKQRVSHGLERRQKGKRLLQS